MVKNEIFGLFLIAWFSLFAATANAGTETYNYDSLGRVRQVNFADGSIVSYQYDGAGNRIQINNTAIQTPTVGNVSMSTAYNTPGTVTLTPAGSWTSLSIVSQSPNGNATISGTTATFTPATNFTGTTSFTYRATGPGGNSPNGTVSVTVNNTPSVTVVQVTGAGNLRTLANAGGYTGAAPGNFEFVVASGVTVTGATNGGRAIDTGTWPAGSTLLLTVQGNIYGGGGNGGNGVNSGTNSGNGYPGTAGGDAVYAQAPITVNIQSGASVKGGGGGGGGGAYATSSPVSIGGDGGGGGFPNGIGGAGSSGSAGDQSAAGTNGTVSGGGAGGASGPSGGSGGNAATAGSSGASAAGTGGAGGAAGYAVRKNGNTVTVNNSGTVAGTVN